MVAAVVHVPARHTFWSHVPVAQSLVLPHVLPSAHAAQSPPQSTSLSLGSFTPFVQWSGCWHTPQVSVPPQPSLMTPQSPAPHAVFGMHAPISHVCCALHVY